MFALLNLLVVGALFAGMFVLQLWGRRIGEREWAREPDRERGGTAAEAAVFGLLGLFLAFTFSGAASRFDDRRDLVAAEANDIGTAWLRVDLLPADRQPQVRDLLRRYVDARIDTYRQSDDEPAAQAARAQALTLQGEIWSASVAGAAATGETAPFTLLLPALNDMFDIVTTREAALLKHPPPVVFAMLAILALIGSLFGGYGMARKARSWVHSLGFTGVMAMALYVIIDFEFPRLGLVRVDSVDVLLIDVRASMN